ncbi:MAG: PIN domain-containing protein, partial [Actinomycetota bacterium]|nr:PIN domain-containing protein [Actinomycetota bacterium]
VAAQGLSQPAVLALDAATAADEPIYVSAISLLELVYLAESLRLTAEQVRLVDEALRAEDSAFEVYPVDERVARAVAEIPRADVPNPQDRVIGATALVLGAPLVTKDRALRACPAVTTIW